jgi:nucleoside-diphosphate kinase
MSFTIGIIKPRTIKGAEQTFYDVEALLNIYGYKITKKYTCKLKPLEVDQLYFPHVDAEWYPKQRAYMTEDLVYVFLIEGPNACQFWRNLIGPTDPKNRTIVQLRRAFMPSNDLMYNGFHGSAYDADAVIEKNLLFDRLGY